MEFREIKNPRVVQGGNFYVLFATLPNGKNVAEYHNRNGNITRLEVDFDQEQILSDPMVYSCLVSWFNENDAVVLNRDGSIIRSGRQEEVLVGITKNNFMTNANYLDIFFRLLLEENRVRGFIERSLEVRPVKGKCGRYIGEVCIIDGKFRKYYIPRLGEEAHNLPSAENARQEHIQSLNAEIERIKKESEKQISNVREQISRYE